MNLSTSLRHSWHRSTLAVALAGSVLMWAALPPLAWSWLAWVAPVPWLLLVRSDQLSGRRPYLALWLAGFTFWLLAIQWLRLPHPAVYLGWAALSAYLACYLPVFVGLSRVAVHRIGVPLWLAGPTIWTGLELVRGHLMTGFLMGSLAHTQVGWTALIQLSDLAGQYGVDFLVMLVAACIASFVPRRPPNVEQEAAAPSAGWRPLALLPGVVAMAAVLAYGHGKLAQATAPARDETPPGPRIALIQGNSLAEWKYDPARERQIMDEYISLSEQAVELAPRQGSGRPIDLVVWPETMFRTRLVTVEPGYQMPAGATHTPDEIASYGPADLAALVRRLNTPVLVGIERIHLPAAPTSASDPPPARRYNSAVLVDRDGNITGTYDKVHRVAFGEYIPLAKSLPWLYKLTPLTGGIEPGNRPVVLELEDHFYAPNICYETVVPHVIRRQAATRAGGGAAPDVLINLTNDAWYWGSSELDMHLACGVFRAIETRTPLVIAANGGLSAWIDRFGRVRAQSPRQQPDIILADIDGGSMRSRYVELGDWFAEACLAFTAVMSVIGLWQRHAKKFEFRQGDSETRRQGEYQE